MESSCLLLRGFPPAPAGRAPGSLSRRCEGTWRQGPAAGRCSRDLPEPAQDQSASVGNFSLPGTALGRYSRNPAPPRAPAAPQELAGLMREKAVSRLPALHILNTTVASRILHCVRGMRVHVCLFPLITPLGSLID